MRAWPARADPVQRLRTPECGANIPPVEAPTIRHPKHNSSTHLRMLPFTSRADVLDAVASVYVDGPWLARTLQRYRPYICPFEALVDRVPAGSRVLDVGCGSGLFLALLAKRARLVQGLGFDVRQAAVRYADSVRTRLPDPSVLTFVHDAGSFVWPARQFDVVSMVDVMHHVAPHEQRGVIAKVAAALRPGGLFVYKDMVTRPRWRALANRLHDLLLAGQWIHYLAMADVVDAARDEGMTLVDAGSFNRFWYGHELAVFRLDALCASSMT